MEKRKVLDSFVKYTNVSIILVFTYVLINSGVDLTRPGFENFDAGIFKYIIIGFIFMMLLDCLKITLQNFAYLHKASGLFGTRLMSVIALEAILITEFLN